jgi:hypothetical protein
MGPSACALAGRGTSAGWRHGETRHAHPCGLAAMASNPAGCRFAGAFAATLSLGLNAWTMRRQCREAR